MSRLRRRMCTPVAVLVLLAAAPRLARAQSDYSDKDFSVRLPPAFLRFTEVSVMGGETVANRYSSASNPAAAGWTDPNTPLGLVIAPYYSAIGFQEGQWLHLTGETIKWFSKDWGAFQPTLSQIRSNNSTAADGLSFDYEVDTAQLQWGKRWGDVGFGACFNFARARIGRDGTTMTSAPPIPVPVPAATVSDSTAESYRWRFGGLWQPVEKWLAGLVFEYGFASYRSKATTVIGAPPPFGPITVVNRREGIAHQFVLRPGVSYEYAPLSSVYFDYQYGVFFNEDGYNLISHRFSAGVEHHILPFMLVRFGPSIDARGNLGLSAGTSLFLGPNVSLEFGYQYNMLPELRPEFGRSQTLQGVLAIRF